MGNIVNLLFLSRAWLRCLRCLAVIFIGHSCHSELLTHGDEVRWLKFEDRWVLERGERARRKRSGKPCDCQTKYQNAREQRKIIYEMFVTLVHHSPRHPKSATN